MGDVGTLGSPLLAQAPRAWYVPAIALAVRKVV